MCSRSCFLTVFLDQTIFQSMQLSRRHLNGRGYLASVIIRIWFNIYTSVYSLSLGFTSTFVTVSLVHSTVTIIYSHCTYPLVRLFAFFTICQTFFPFSPYVKRFSQFHHMSNVFPIFPYGGSGSTH